jgi:hypothetical protein
MNENKKDSKANSNAAGIDPNAMYGVCLTCKYWRPEPRHKLWGRCGRVDHEMQYGAITQYPYDYPESERVRLNPWNNEGRISTYRDFGCNRYAPLNSDCQQPEPDWNES